MPCEYSCGASEDRQFYHSPVSSGCGRRDEDTLSCRETVIGSDHLCERVCLLGMTKSTDVALLKTLREYERVYAHLCTQSAPASERLQDQVADAVRGIQEELRRRGRIVPPLDAGRCKRDRA